MEKIEFIQLLQNIIEYPITQHRNKNGFIVNVPEKLDRNNILIFIKNEFEKIYPCILLNKFQCKSTYYSSIGVLKVNINSNDYFILVKYSHNGVTLNDITAVTFTKLATIITINNEEFYSFDNIKQLEESIIKGCQETKSINNDVVELFNLFFITGKLDWSNIEPKSLIAKLGIYLSEILIGWIFLSNRQNEFINSEDVLINNAKVKLFCVPCNSNYNDIDSFLILEDNTRISISNKFGAGAPASFFTGIMKHI